MAQSGFTPILLYASSTPSAAPAAGNLTSSAAGAELALNYADGKLFYKDSGGSVQTLATKGTGSIGGSTTQVQYNSSGSLAGSANLTFNGTTLTANSATVSTGNLTFSGTAQRITGDMSNATIANRLAFQTSTTNGATRLMAIPNGTSTTTAFNVLNSSDPNNASWLSVGVSNIEATINATISGTGTYLPMTFYTGGSERVRIDTSGNVGIGTASPQVRLHAVAADGVTNARFAGASYALRVQSIAATGTVVDATNNTEATYQPLLIGGSQVQFTIASTERMRVDTSGNVAVGTTNAGTAGLSLSQNYNLSWEQSATESIPNLFRQTSSAALVMSVGYKRSATANGFASSFGSSLAKTAISLGTTAGAITFYTDTAATTAVGTDVTPTERMRIDSSGNVGIGRAPNYNLDVYRSGTTTATIAAANDNIVTVMRASGSTEAVIGPITSHPLVLLSANVERLRIDSSGNVGIGTASPGAKLDVVGAIYSNDSLRLGSGKFVAFSASAPSVSNFSLYGDGTQTVLNAPSAGVLKFNNNNVEQMRITATGNIVAGASAALATTATDGFLYVPTCAGTPTGTPTAITGMAPIVVDTTNNKLYFYSGGAWRDAGP